MTADEAFRAVWVNTERVERLAASPFARGIGRGLSQVNNKQYCHCSRNPLYAQENESVQTTLVAGRLLSSLEGYWEVLSRTANHGRK